MEVTGFQIKEALKMANLELSTWREQFDGSLHTFKDEKKMSPIEIMAKVTELENIVATLQAAQSGFNLTIQVKAGDAKMPLEKAIKLVGGAGRTSSMWRQAAGVKKSRNFYNDQELSRKADEERAKPTINNAEALTLAKEAEKFASRLRGAIAVGNTMKVDITGLDPLWFA